MTVAARESSSRGASPADVFKGDGFKGDPAAMSASSTADRRRFMRGRAAAAAASMARSARIAWFLSTDASRAPSRVPTTIRITPSVRFVTADASAAATSTKKSCASWPQRVIRASGMSASAGPRNEKPARDTLMTHDCSTILSVFAAAQAFLCLSAWWCSGGFFSQRTAALAQATTTSCSSMNHLEVF
jgi:hypothetical protein